MKPRSILVVDDEPAFCDMLSLMLERAGYQVATAANGLAGSQCLDQKTFDLVLTDMLMPERDGLEFIADVLKKAPHTRIVAMTGGGHIPSNQYLKMARGLGAHGMLAKPFSQAELLCVVEQALATDSTPPLP